MPSRTLCALLVAAALLASPATALVKMYCSPGGYDRQVCGTDADVSRICNSTPLQVRLKASRCRKSISVGGTAACRHENILSQTQHPIP